MTPPGKYVRSLFVVAALVAVVGYAAWPKQASAACGSTSSSCQDCHEAKKQGPVNANGAWHTAHAFGDFCEFCHGGNVKATDKAAAHVGLVDPLSDVKASCQSCHPNDFADRAQTYATTLGKTVGMGGATGTSTTSGATSGTPGSTTPCAPAAPAGSTTIDLNKIYAATKSPPSANPGNIILGVLIIGTTALLGGLVWHYDHPLERLVGGFRRVLATPAPVPSAEGSGGTTISPELALRPELRDLLPLLQSTDPSTARALARLLSDPENGPKVIRALSSLDLRSLSALSEGDQRALAALLALTREMKAQD
jgi:hypothetical protein